jgi:hypothetical protein
MRRGEGSNDPTTSEKAPSIQFGVYMSNPGRGGSRPGRRADRPETNEVVAAELLRADFIAGQGGMSAGSTTAWTSAANAIARIDY